MKLQTSVSFSYRHLEYPFMTCETSECWRGGIGAIHLSHYYWLSLEKIGLSKLAFKTVSLKISTLEVPRRTSFNYSITELPLLLAPRLLEFYPVITKLPLPFPANINSSILILLWVKIKSISLPYPGQRIQILWVNQLKFFYYYY